MMRGIVVVGLDNPIKEFFEDDDVSADGFSMA